MRTGQPLHIDNVTYSPLVKDGTVGSRMAGWVVKGSPEASAEINAGRCFVFPLDVVFSWEPAL